MRHTLFPLAVALCTTLASAQNEFEIYPGDDGAGTVSVSRGDAGAGAGSLFQEYPPSHIRGIGGDPSGCALTAFEFIVQDQNGITQETFTLAARSGDASGPTLGGAGLLTSVPIVTPVAAAGPVAMQFTVTLASPVTIPCDDHFFVGHQFEADADWPATDGIAAANYTYAQDPFLAGTPNHAWQIIGDPDLGTVSQPSERLVNMGLRGDAAVINVGVSSLFRPRIPDFGAAGLYPDVRPTPGAEDGLIFRVRDGSNADGVAIVLLGTGFDPAFPLAFLGLDAVLWMTTNLVGQVASGAINEGGEAIIVPAWLDFGSVHRFAGAGPVYFQALTYTPGSPPTNVRMSNAIATRL